ncbi:hypothetical protein CMO90_04330 [Candidatus Woesearchaeota archaeon]|jgi:predicted ArsR family transcriptional regulator|nr:hypothetical protein [Candidatus Woesearchaeota archaeon]|tara:strand:+ start:987 stop:1433 length:447 start_codon:yes stop_codon:yes gene_type:complete
MVDETLTTTVDSLINLLKEVDKIELEEAAKKLDLSVDIIQSWVDFLVEEKLVGIEYKFTTPYIYFNKPKEKSKAEKKEEESIEKMKEDFHKKAAEKKISKIEAKDLWKNHLLQKMDKKKDFFFKESRKRGLFNPEELWKEYKDKLLNS